MKRRMLTALMLAAFLVSEVAVLPMPVDAQQPVYAPSFGPAPGQAPNGVSNGGFPSPSFGDPPPLNGSVRGQYQGQYQGQYPGFQQAPPARPMSGPFFGNCNTATWPETVSVPRSRFAPRGPEVPGSPPVTQVAAPTVNAPLQAAGLRPEPQGSLTISADGQRTAPDGQRLPLDTQRGSPDTQRTDPQRPDALRTDPQRPDAQPTDPQRPDAHRPDAQRAPERPEEPLSRIEAGFDALPPSIMPLPTPLRQYGYSMFASAVSTFAPVDDIPVGPDYTLGPGDDLTINVWGPVDSTVVRTVDRNGRIVLPKVGDLRVWGLTFSQADTLIRDQLSRYFRGFQTSVTMGRLRTVRVHVVGEVCQPGVYTLSALATLTNGLFSAGGPTKLGSLRQVKLLRNSHQVGTLDLYEFLQNGDRTRDFRLESGDTIFVPTIGDVVAVGGEVKRPAIYELRGDTKVSDVVTMAGGVTPSGYLRRVQLVRAQPSAERVTLDIDLSRYYAAGDESANALVRGGDLVMIHRSDPRIYNLVKVEGTVKYPGVYELKPGMRIGELLTPDALLPEAYTEHVEVARRRDDLSLEITAVDLKKAWKGDPEQDVLLKRMDEVTVRSELKSTRAVLLAGQVLRPGWYVIADGERLSSVLERAGGFTGKAYLKSAVFTRAALRKVEQEQLDAFVKMQEKRILATAATTVIGAEKDEAAQQQQALQARRELLKALAARVAVGRMVVRLEQPSRLRGTPDDIVLVDGDALTVPEPPASVLVIGAVRNSTSVTYKEDGGVEYYINRVGGLSKEADKKELHIVKADGSAVSGFSKIRPVEPGDTIVVPPKEEEKTRLLPTFRDILQTLGGALISLAALAVLF